jgi:hypothetical protein
MKPTIFLLIAFICTAQTAIGQSAVIPGTKPSTNQVDVMFPANNNAAQSRRATAVAKVQQKAAPIQEEYGDETASFRPAQYGDTQTATPAQTKNPTTVTVNGPLVEMKIKKT